MYHIHCMYVGENRHTIRSIGVKIVHADRHKALVIGINLVLFVGTMFVWGTAL